MRYIYIYNAFLLDLAFFYRKVFRVVSDRFFFFLALSVVVFFFSFASPPSLCVCVCVYIYIYITNGLSPSLLPQPSSVRPTHRIPSFRHTVYIDGIPGYRVHYNDVTSPLYIHIHIYIYIYTILKRNRRSTENESKRKKIPKTRFRFPRERITIVRNNRRRS